MSIRYSIISSDTIKKIDVQFQKELKKKIKTTPGLRFKKEKQKRNKQSVTDLAFCPVVSRAGTDIESTLRQIEENKPAILVVLHHTFDPDTVVSDSHKFVKREDTVTVDCLFHEDKGLLKCKRNDDAYEQIIRWLKQKKPKLLEIGDEKKKNWSTK